MGLYDDKGRAKYWLYTFKLPGKKQKKGTTKVPIKLEGRVSAANKKQAQTIFEKARAEALANIHLNIPKKILFNAVVAFWLSTKPKGGRDLDSYRSILKPVLEYFKDRFAQEITQEEVELYRVWRLEHGLDDEGKIIAKEICRSTVNKEMAYLGAAYSCAVKFKKLIENPVRGIGKKEWSEKELMRERYFNFEEKQKILISASKSTYTPLADIVAFDLITGMRRSEITNLLWSSVDLVRGIITVEESKAGCKRHLGINAELRNILMSKCRDFEFVFAWKGKKIKEDTLSHAFLRCVRAAEVPDAHSHDLRHTFASDFATQSKDMRRLQYLLGHASPEMTQRYAHFVDSAEVNAQLDKLPSLPVYPVFIPIENKIELSVA